MANLTYRASSPAAPASTTTKTTGLTNADVDGNFKSLDDAKYEKSGGTISGNLTVTGSSSLNSLSVTNTITGSITGNAATVTTNANLTGDVTSVGNATTYTTVGTAKGGTNITSYAAGDVLYASAVNTLSKLAKGSDGQVLKLSGGFPAWGTDNDTTYNIGDGALTVASTAAATNVAITLALSGAYSANTATARSLDFKVGPALTNLATLMTTSAAGFIRRSGQDSYSVDTSTYSLSSHGHYIGTTAVQASSADQSLGGILSVTGGTASNFTLKTADVASAATGILYIKSGDVTAGNASSGAVGINSGSGFGTQAAGSVSIYSGDGGLTSATGGNVSIQGGGSRAVTSTGGNVSVRGGSALSTATTAATGGNVFILGGRTYNASGTKAGGNVYIDGGIDGSTASQYVTTAGTVNIGNNASGVGGAGTSAVNIGSTSATTTIAGIIKLPTVGTSGFVKLGTGGQLSADTTTYATGSGTASGTNTGDQTIPTTLPNANAVTFTSSGGAAAGSTYTGASALTVDYSTVGAAASGHTHSYQAADGDLLAIGGLTGTSGFLKKTAADTWTLDTATYLTTYTDTNTITRLRGTASGTYTSGDLTLAAGSNVTVTQSGSTYTIASSYTDTNTTYTASTGLTLTGTAFSANYGTSSTTACAGNDSRLSNSRPHNGTALTATTGTFSDVTTIAYVNPVLVLKDTISSSALSNHNISFRDLNNTEKVGFGTSDSTLYLYFAGTSAYTITSNNFKSTGNISCVQKGDASAYALKIVGGTGTDGTYGGIYFVDAAGTSSWGMLSATAANISVNNNFLVANKNLTLSGGNLSVTGTGSFSGTVTLPTITAQAATALTITGAASSTTAGTAYAVSITGGTGGDGVAAGKGGAVNITGGRSGNNSTSSGAVMGGTVTIVGGAGNTLYTGATPGEVVITGGPPQIAGQRGADVLIGASSAFSSATSADGGNLTLYAGSGVGSGGSNGIITLQALGSGGGNNPIIKFTTGGATGGNERARINSYGLSVGTTADADTVAGAGSILAAGNITAYSDARIKTNIVKITDALDKVEQLNGYTFDRTDTETTRQTGVIAQEVLKVLPEAVLGSEDTTYSVAYGNMMGLMIEAIKELNAKVVDLQNQLANK